MEVFNLVINVLNKRLIIFNLIIYLLVFQTVLGASAGTSLALNVEKSNYIISDDGDLHISVIGAVLGTSAFFCKFSLSFLDNFSMNTLDDGTPVLKFENDGFPIENTFSESIFQIDFQLNSFNTTSLPNHFILTVTSMTESESAIIKPEWQVREDSSINNNEIFIADPTGQTGGYQLSKSQTGLIELLGSRGKTYQHYYDMDNGKYKFVSNSLVKKSDVIDGADWLTFQEYPIRFLVQTTDNNILSFTQDEISSFSNEIANNSVQRILIDTFNGMAGFSVVSQESSTLGHGETIFYPRLSNGSVPSINNPYFSSFGRLSVLKDGKYSSEIINNRSFFIDDSKEPINSLHFETDKDIFQIWYELKDITIFSQQFDLRIGLKYNSTERKFHTINHVTCKTMDYDDIGFGYEICDSIQETILASNLTKLEVQNSTHYINLPVNSSIDIKTSFSDILPQLSVFNENNNVLDYSFADMKQVGFTNSNFKVHDCILPFGKQMKSIFVGMDGYGKYSKGNTLEIDPTFTSTILDNNDVSLEIMRVNPYTKTKKTDYNWVGFTNGDDKEYRSFLSWDIGITEDIATISDSILHLFCATTTFEYGVPQLKLIKQYTGSSPNENDDINTLYSYFQYSTYVAPGYLSHLNPEYNTTENKQVDYYLNFWADNKGSGSVIKFRIQEYYADYDEYCRYDTDALAPSLSFDYEYPVHPPFIISFGTENSYKGEEQHLMTYIYNGDSHHSFSLDHLSYEIQGNDYDNWVDLTPETNYDLTLEPTTQYIVHDYIDPIFTNYYGNASYALNSGEYQVNKVKATGEMIGGNPWTDTHDFSSFGNAAFNVLIERTKHKVFVAHLVDDDFRDRFNEDEFFNNTIDENETFRLFSSSGDITTLKGRFKIDMISKVFSWECDNTDIDDLYNELIDDVAPILGLTESEWDEDPSGTSTKNHGFDLLYGHSSDRSDDGRFGRADKPGNVGVLMAGYVNYLGWDAWITDSELIMCTWHELLHSYGCEHLVGFDYWYFIMSYDDNFGGLAVQERTLHEDTDETIWNNINHFDGSD